jgi:hypothetical protein
MDALETASIPRVSDYRCGTYRSDLPNVKMAVCAFSGGIDGTFSVARHAKRLLGEASLPVRAAVLVHGFDVPLSKSQSFEKLVHRCRPTLDSFGVELITIRTDLRESTRPTWLDAFGAQLACCLHQLDAVADAGIIGSNEPYSQLYFPLDRRRLRTIFYPEGCSPLFMMVPRTHERLRSRNWEPSRKQSKV